MQLLGMQPSVVWAFTVPSPQEGLGSLNPRAGLWQLWQHHDGVGDHVSNYTSGSTAMYEVRSQLKALWCPLLASLHVRVKHPLDTNEWNAFNCTTVKSLALSHAWHICHGGGDKGPTGCVLVQQPDRGAFSMSHSSC